MKKIFNSYIFFVSIFLIKIALKFNNHRLCGFILWLNIKKIKKIKNKLDNSKKILVFPKSGGFEYLIESFAGKKNNITFYILPRGFLKEIMHDNLGACSDWQKGGELGNEKASAAFENYCL